MYDIRIGKKYKMIIVNGILNNIDIEKIETNLSEITLRWFTLVDRIYFSKEDYRIRLSKFDKILISKSKDCLDKLNILNFKENIVIENL